MLVIMSRGVQTVFVDMDTSVTFSSSKISIRMYSNSVRYGLGLCWCPPDYGLEPVMIVDLLRYDNFVVSFTESCPQRIT